MVFLIDLPRLPDTSEHRPTEFSTELCRFLRACQVDEKLVLSLSNYDFSRTTQLGFVHTMFVTPRQGKRRGRPVASSLVSCEELEGDRVVWMDLLTVPITS